MPRQKHTASQKQTPNRKKAKPDLSRPTPAQAGSGQREAQTDPGVYGGAFTEERLSGAQRRSFASQVGHVLGNQQLRRLVASGGSGSAPHWPAGGQAIARLLKAGLHAQPLSSRMAVQAKKGDKKATTQTPLEMLRDELGDVFVDEPACLRYIALLGPQVATARNDKWLMGRMAAAFNAAEMLQAVRQLALELKWAIYWIDRAREAGSIGAKGYDTLIAASPAGQVARLIGWGDMLEVVKTNRSGNPLTMFPPLNAHNPMLAHVFGAYGHFVDWALADAGAPQLLHFLLAHNPKAMAGALDKSGRWTPFVTKLPKGMALAPADKSALQRLAQSTGNPKTQADLFEVRFNVTTRETGTQPWESKGLMRAWQVLNLLPAADVEGNPNLQRFLRGGSKIAQGLSDMTTYVKYWYRVNKVGAKEAGEYSEATEPMYGMVLFDRVVIHEIGHTVDGPTCRFSKSYCKTTPGGGWKWLTAQSAVDAMIAASPWSISLPKAWTAGAVPAKGKAKTWEHWLAAGATALMYAGVGLNARQACINAATKHTKVRDEANTIDPKGNLWKMIRNQRVVRAIEPALASNDPWYNHAKQIKFGNRYYHEGYPGAWQSYLSDRYDAKLSQYQFRDPRDWFAETYSCYYGSMDPTSPKMEDAGKKVPEPIRSWFKNSVAKTAPMPAAKKAAP